MSLKDAILRSALHVEKISVPEWPDADGHIYIAPLRASDMGVVEKLGEGSGSEALVGWCVLGIVDEKGNRIFSMDDSSLLAEQPLPVLQRVAEHIMELSGLAPSSAKELRGN